MWLSLGGESQYTIHEQECCMSNKAQRVGSRGPCEAEAHTECYILATL